jgi:hypothetical protein
MARPPYGRWVYLFVGNELDDVPDYEIFFYKSPTEDGQENFPVEYVILTDTRTVQSASGHGLNVYGSSGELLYSSTHRSVVLDFSISWPIPIDRGLYDIESYPGYLVPGQTIYDFQQKFIGAVSSLELPVPQIGRRFVSMHPFHVSEFMQNYNAQKGYIRNVTILQFRIINETSIEVAKHFIADPAGSGYYDVNTGILIDVDEGGLPTTLVAGSY